VQSTDNPVSSTLGIWLSAFRLRTLPLALASISMGSFLAAYEGSFEWSVFGLAAFTTILLQILSNLSNDYGDTIHGADHAQREGPSRAVQSGAISTKAMRMAIIIFAILSLISGIALLLVSSLGNNLIFILFLLLGISAIAAAIRYTSGKNPYGYLGLGDLSVLLFFGLLGVLGTYYLHTGELRWIHILPALSCGLFSVGVLNINNIRDIESDKKAGKKTIPVRLGRTRAVWYHWSLLVIGSLTAVLFVVLQFSSLLQFIFFLSFPLLIWNGVGVTNKTTASDLDPYLKQLVFSTLFFVLSFGLGLLISV